LLIIFEPPKKALKKNGSLAFAEGMACAVGAKANVPFAGWHKIVFKKCGGKKIKNIGSVSVSVYMLSVCNIVSMSVFTCQNGLLFLFMSLVCLSCRCLNTLAGNI
jgi:hypothetical protein